MEAINVLIGNYENFRLILLLLFFDGVGGGQWIAGRESPIGMCSVPPKQLTNPINIPLHCTSHRDRRRFGERTFAPSRRCCWLRQRWKMRATENLLGLARIAVRAYDAQFIHVACAAAHCVHAISIQRTESDGAFSPYKCNGKSIRRVSRCRVAHTRQLP